MPLTALSQDDGLVIGPLLADAEWEALQARARREHSSVVTRCCGHPAQPRRSKLGLRHFAHRPGADCRFGESEHHLALKALLYAALADHGWDVGLEEPLGDARVDVLATRGQERVAFEVQWSSQSLEETEGRSERYARHGIRTVWLFRRALPPELQGRPDIPCFQVSSSEPGRYDIHLGGQTVDVDRFVALWNSGFLRPAQPDVVLGAHFVQAACPNCRRQTPVAAIRADTAPTTACGLWRAVDEAAIREAYARLEASVLAGDLADVGLMPSRLSTSRTFWTERCEHCGIGVPQRPVRLADPPSDRPPIPWEWSTAPGRGAAEPHWCVPKSHGGCSPEPADGRAPLRRMAEAVAEAVSRPGHEAGVRAPRLAATSSQTPALMVQVPDQAAAIVCSSAALGPVEQQVLAARLALRLTFLHLTGGSPVNRASLRVLPPKGVPASGWTVELAAPADLKAWADTVTRRGSVRLADDLVAGGLQSVDVYEVGLSCWKCAQHWTGVLVEGVWQSDCGRELEDIVLWEEAAGAAVARAIQEGTVQTKARIERRYSKTMRATGAGRDRGWANVCPVCASFYGQNFLRQRRPLKAAIATLTFSADRQPAAQRPSRPHRHLCAHCPPTDRSMERGDGLR